MPTSSSIWLDSMISAGDGGDELGCPMRVPSVPACSRSRPFLVAQRPGARSAGMGAHSVAGFRESFAAELEKSRPLFGAGRRKRSQARPRVVLQLSFLVDRIDG